MTDTDQTTAPEKPALPPRVNSVAEEVRKFMERPASTDRQSVAFMLGFAVASRQLAGFLSRDDCQAFKDWLLTQTDLDALKDAVWPH